MNPKKISITLFFTILVMLPILTFLLPKKTFSETENRPLATAPKISVESILDKTYMDNAEQFMSDHMVLRDNFTSAKTKLELLQGRREINKVFISDKKLLENIGTPDNLVTSNNIEAINKFAAKYKGRIDTSIMLIPTAVEFYPELTPQLVKIEDQTKYIQNFYSGLKNVTCIDSYAPLSSVAEEYVFFRTDHHWTSYGAYIGYTALSKSLGFKPATYDMFNIEHASHDFLGTLYSKVLCGEKLKDDIDIYHYAKGEVVTDVIKYTGKNKQTYPSILFRDKLNEKDKYGVFLGSNEPIVKVKTNVQNGKKLIVFKDSYSHALMQFLPLHYEEIALVDLRYLNKPLNQYLSISEYQQALFMYNMAGFIKDSSLKKVVAY